MTFLWAVTQNPIRCDTFLGGSQNPFFHGIYAKSNLNSLSTFPNNTHIKTIPAKMQQVFIQNLKARQKFNFVYNIFFKVSYRIESLGYNYPTFSPNRGL